MIKRLNVQPLRKSGRKEVIKALPEFENLEELIFSGIKTREDLLNILEIADELHRLRKATLVVDEEFSRPEDQIREADRRAIRQFVSKKRDCMDVEVIGVNYSLENEDFGMARAPI